MQTEQHVNTLASGVGGPTSSCSLMGSDVMFGRCTTRLAGSRLPKGSSGLGVYAVPFSFCCVPGVSSSCRHASRVGENQHVSAKTVYLDHVHSCVHRVFVTRCL